MAFLNSQGEKVSAKKYVQDYLRGAVEAARDSFSDPDLTDKQTVAVKAQFERLGKRLGKVLGAKPAEPPAE